MSGPPLLDFVVRSDPLEVDFDIRTSSFEVDFFICNPEVTPIEGLFLPVVLSDGTTGYVPVGFDGRISVALPDGSTAYLQTDGVVLTANLADNSTAFVNLVTL